MCLRLSATPWTAGRQAPSGPGTLRARTLGWVLIPFPTPGSNSRLSRVSCVGNTGSSPPVPPRAEVGSVFRFFKAPPASRAAPELDLALPANSEGEPRPCLPVRSRLADAVAALSVSGAAFPRSQNLRPAHLLPDLSTRVFLF